MKKTLFYFVLSMLSLSNVNLLSSLVVIIMSINFLERFYVRHTAQSRQVYGVFLYQQEQAVRELIKLNMHTCLVVHKQ